MTTQNLRLYAGSGGQVDITHEVGHVGIVDIAWHLDGVGRRVNLRLHELIIRGNALAIEEHIIDLEGPGVLTRVEQSSHSLFAADDLLLVPVSEVDGGRGSSLVPRRVEEGCDLLRDGSRVEELADEVFLTVGIPERESANNFLLVVLQAALGRREESQSLNTEVTTRIVGQQLLQDDGVVDTRAVNRLLLA